MTVPKIIDNERFRLLDVLKEVSGDFKDLSIATGYWDLKAMLALKDELEKLLNKKIDVYFTPDKILEYGFVDNQNKIIQTQRELEIEINNYLKEK